MAGGGVTPWEGARSNAWQEGGWLEEVQHDKKIKKEVVGKDAREMIGMEGGIERL